MLFNSWAFTFGFLPVVFIGYYVSKACVSPTIAKVWLGFASLIFYAWWSVGYLIVLLASTVANFYIAWIIGSQPFGYRRTTITTLAITANLAVLCYFKYVVFFASVLNAALGLSFVVGGVVLPLGISFFTFQKVVYLADIHAGQTAEKSWINFLLFVAFFPQLIAGPIVHHREVLPQFARASSRGWPDWTDLAVGFTLFSIGLFKKTMLADPIGEHSTLVFTAAANGITLTTIEAWLGAVSYGFQIYFDFSGYSDMAIGLARLFSVRLPLNFASPYKSLNIIDFWRRWHITLSRILLHYVYIPLGGNRRGALRRYVNLLFVMLIGGLWHGAGWTFIIWGGLHGCYLLVNHAWRALGDSCEWARFPKGSAGNVAAFVVTFGAVMFAWVFFRAPSMATAVSMVKSMFGLMEVSTDPNAEMIRRTVFGNVYSGLALLVVLFSIAVLAPNSQTLLRRFEPALNWRENTPPLTLFDRHLIWQPTIIWGCFVGGCFALSVLSFSNVHEFIYFNF